MTTERPVKCNIHSLCDYEGKNAYCYLSSYRQCHHYNFHPRPQIQPVLERILDESEATELLIEQVKKKMREGEQP